MFQSLALLKHEHFSSPSHGLNKFTITINRRRCRGVFFIWLRNSRRKRWIQSIEIRAKRYEYQFQFWVNSNQYNDKLLKLVAEMEVREEKKNPFALVNSRRWLIEKEKKRAGEKIAQLQWRRKWENATVSMVNNFQLWDLRLNAGNKNLQREIEKFKVWKLKLKNGISFFSIRFHTNLKQFLHEQEFLLLKNSLKCLILTGNVTLNVNLLICDIFAPPQFTMKFNCTIVTSAH